MLTNISAFLTNAGIKPQLSSPDWLIACDGDDFITVLERETTITIQAVTNLESKYYCDSRNDLSTILGHVTEFIVYVKTKGIRAEIEQYAKKLESDILTAEKYIDKDEDPYL